jgi:solute carrier family 35 protein E3
MPVGPKLESKIEAAISNARRNNIINAIIMLANMVSVVGCVVLIKAVYQAPYNFTYANTILTVHFLTTASLVNLAALCGFHTPKRLPLMQYVMLSVAQVGSVALVNLSLLYNSVGMYQVLKFCNIPVICLVEFVFLRTVYSLETYLALVGIVIGVCMTTATEIKFSGLGLGFGLAGTVATAAYQVLNKNIQKDFEVNAMQLLQYESWFTAFWSFLLALVADDSGLSHYEWTGGAVALIGLGGLCAFGVNVTCYLVIGRTSPVTYGVTGHIKTLAILLFGYMVLHQPFSPYNLCGVVIAFSGMVYYSYIKLKEQKEQIQAAEASDSKTDKAAT